eukprot:TRINITY_DN60041_c0_g1_i1.p2 TRINITY_DN60041_c0_g1~~TRINITY_DN60041_c0_g1_i1.p2  ORF type:complete len:266 (+),score=144.72 TRINITY_DN60041_c0_g1_i1:100-798(+)
MSKAALRALAAWDKKEKKVITQRHEHDLEQQRLEAAERKEARKRARERQLDDDHFEHKVEKMMKKQRKEAAVEKVQKQAFFGATEEINPGIIVDRSKKDSFTGWGHTFHDAQIVGARSRLAREAAMREVRDRDLKDKAQKEKEKFLRDLTKEQRLEWEAKMARRREREQTQYKKSEMYLEELQQHCIADNQRNIQRVKKAAQSVAWLAEPRIYDAATGRTVTGTELEGGGEA